MKHLFCDCKTDEEKANFFLSGRAVETGIIAPAISNDVAMAYHRCAQFKKENDELRVELETERMRLAACGVVALANTPDSAKQAREMRPEYWSASCGDVARMVDENIKLRARIREMERQEPVGEIRRANSTGNYINPVVWVPMAVGAKLYALPGAKGERK